MALVARETTRTPRFEERSDADQVRILTEILPERWRFGGRDSIGNFGATLGLARDSKIYKKCGCKSWEEFCDRYFDGPSKAFDELILGVRILEARGQEKISELDARKAVSQHARGEVDLKPGRPKKGENRSRTVLSGRGTTAPYRLRRLAKLKPAVLDAYERGEFPSVDAAFRHAFALDEMRRAWARASAEDREAFLAEIAR
jgi:hypothetical protein